ncbi:hypothetical protein [Pseudotenacibaculum haliotis]|uniref:Uncharacterized protein n=1 Tax=Pseudotenacibaculum haliotis TaxID=1862138 RepID=A0ABW5LRC6_9FLAO
MNNEEIKRIIDQIDSESKDAYIGIFYEDNLDPSYIKGNRSGFIKLAAECLKIAHNFGVFMTNKNELGASEFKKDDWFDQSSHINLEWVKPTYKFREEILEEKEENEENSSALREKINNFIAISILFLILISIPAGLYQLIKWLIQLF